MCISTVILLDGVLFDPYQNEPRSTQASLGGDVKKNLASGEMSERVYTCTLFLHRGPAMLCCAVNVGNRDLKELESGLLVPSP